MRTRSRVGVPLAAALAASLAGIGCAPREAVVETDPRGGAEARRQLEATARADLSGLQRAMASYHEVHATYIYDLEALDFTPSPGIDVSVLEATDAGFSALARSGSVECAVFVGGADPPRSFTRTAGVVACRP